MHWCKIYDIIIKQPNDAVFSGSCRGHADVAQLAEQLICNQQVAGSSPIVGSTHLFNIMERFPSGQREQTVNLLAPPSMVRIHPSPPMPLAFANGICRGVEQLVARRAHNPKVGGSNPSSATTKVR